MRNIFLLFILSFVISLTATADVPLSYYTRADGQKKASLKTALHNCIQPQSVLSYGSGGGSTWSGFYRTDRMADGEVRDRYSNDHRYFPANASASSASAVSGMNIEHSFPKSWWGGSSNNAYKDLFNLMPCESGINSSKSNYAMGTVTKVSVDNGCTKVGEGPTKNGTTRKLWEPADKWKGDFARAYMYMATTYSNFKWESNGLDMLQQDEWPTLQEWAYTLLLKWVREDPVDNIEIARNEAVYKIQGNRNPYIDFPNLAEYVWGDSINRAFDIYTTVKAGQVITDGGGSTEGGDKEDPSDPEPPYTDEDGNVISIDGLLAMCSGSSMSNGAEVTYKFEDLLVTYANGKNIFVSNGKQGFLLYGTNSKSLKAGDRISGTIAGIDYFYYRLPELGFTSLDNVSVVSSGNKVEPLTLTTADVIADNGQNYCSMLVRLNNLTPDDTSFSSKRLTFTDNGSDTSILVYDTWQMFTNTSYSTTKSYEIVAFPILYNKTIELYPVTINEASTTAIDAIETPCELMPRTSCFDLSGRRILTPRQGITLRHGAKIMSR